MNLDDLTIGEVKKLASLFSEGGQPLNNGMIGKYVIVRCRDAGVHSGFLESHNGRECVLTQSRRLWYWKTKKGAFLSSLAMDGVSSDSKVGKEVPRIHLTENCEIIQCTKDAEESIREQPTHNE